MMHTRIPGPRHARLLTITGPIVPHKHSDLPIALVGPGTRSFGKLDEILKRPGRLASGTWVAVVTGQQDAIAEAVVRRGIVDLRWPTTGVIPQAGDIARSRTLVCVESSYKGSGLPGGLEN